MSAHGNSGGGGAGGGGSGSGGGSAGSGGSGGAGAGGGDRFSEVSKPSEKQESGEKTGNKVRAEVSNQDREGLNDRTKDERDPEKRLSQRTSGRGTFGECVIADVKLCGPKQDTAVQLKNGLPEKIETDTQSWARDAKNPQVWHVQEGTQTFDLKADVRIQGNDITAQVKYDNGREITFKNGEPDQIKQPNGENWTADPKQPGKWDVTAVNPEDPTQSKQFQIQDVKVNAQDGSVSATRLVQAGAPLEIRGVQYAPDQLIAQLPGGTVSDATPAASSRDATAAASSRDATPTASSTERTDGFNGVYNLNSDGTITHINPVTELLQTTKGKYTQDQFNKFELKEGFLRGDGAPFASDWHKGTFVDTEQKAGTADTTATKTEQMQPDQLKEQPGGQVGDASKPVTPKSGVLEGNVSMSAELQKIGITAHVQEGDRGKTLLITDIDKNALPENCKHVYAGYDSGSGHSNDYHYKNDFALPTSLFNDVYSGKISSIKVDLQGTGDPAAHITGSIYRARDEKNRIGVFFKANATMKEQLGPYNPGDPIPVGGWLGNYNENAFASLDKRQK